MGIFKGLFSNKKNINRAKTAAGQIQHAGIEAMEAADRERARGIAGEQSRAAVWGLLGSDPNSFTSDRSMTDVFDTSNTGLSQPNQGLWNMGQYDTQDPTKVTSKNAGWEGEGGGGGREALLGGPREGILDPEAYAEAISGTSQFRIQSQRVRESEQLLNQEGPAWDMLSNSVLGVINEGSALQLRDTMRKLKNQYAKGGSARRTAMFEANELMAGERAMRTKVQETWQANLELYDAVRQNADRVAAGTSTFMAGLPLVNDSYRDAMQRTASMQIQASNIAQGAAATAYNVRQSAQPKNFMANQLEGMIKAGPAIVAGIIDNYTGGSNVSKNMLNEEPAGGYSPIAAGVGSILQSAGDWMSTWGDDDSNDSPVGPYADGYETGEWEINRG
jgi:hypothetical protein